MVLKNASKKGKNKCYSKTPVIFMVHGFLGRHLKFHKRQNQKPDMSQIFQALCFAKAQKEGATTLVRALVSVVVFST